MARFHVEHPHMSLNAVAYIPNVTLLIELVDEGVLETVDQEQAQWRFTGTNLLRARTAMRLQHDLDINVARVALALDLMEEIETLPERLSRIEAPANR